MKKVLFVATVTRHINSFHIPYLKYFKENGYEVHVASYGNEPIEYCDKHFDMPFARFPFKIQNYKVYKELKKIIEENQYEVIHCHTPVGGVIARLAARRARKKYNTKVIYTAHGFHFYKGAPILNWILYYPIEKFLARYTDCLITINHEDYERAKKHFSKIKNIKYVHGVGFNTERLDVNVEQNYREQFQCDKNDIVLTYVAELNKNKNQILLVNCIEKLSNQFSNLKLLLVGRDSTNGQLEELIKEKQLQSKVKLLGNRQDIGEILSITDIYVASSLREGLPVNIMEAMYKELPIIALDNRGHRALIENNQNGFIVDNEETMIEKIAELIQNKKLREKVGEKALETSKDYRIDKVVNEMKEIYMDVIKFKVLHILASNKYSGAENVAITIINKMDDRKIKCTYVSPDGPIREKLQEENIEFEPLNKVSIKEIKRVCKKYSPDIIHAHDFTTSVITALASVNSKIVSHLHHNADWIKKVNIKSLLYLFSSIKYKKIILVSDAILKEYIFSKFIIKKAEVVGNPICCNEIIEKSKGDEKNNDKFDLLFVGRLEYEKDPLRFIEIVNKINRENKIRVGIIGEGTLKEKCEEKIKEMSLDKNIKMLGFLKNPYQIMANSKVLCITSKWEGFGLVAVEALTLGLPVVASNVGGLPTIVDDACGKICNENDDFCKEITRLIQDDEYYNNKSIKATQKGKMLENINEYMDKLFDIYTLRKE